MKNRDKIDHINRLCQEILSLNESYSTQDKFYFYYDEVIELLEKAKTSIEESLRSSRPDNLPKDIAWCENVNPEYEFDPFVFDGSMSVQDFKKAQKKTLDDIIRDAKEKVSKRRKENSNNQEEPYKRVLKRTRGW